MKRLSKKLIIFSLCLTLTTTLLTQIASAKTINQNQNNKIEIKLDKNGNPTDETINEISDMLQFIVEDTLILDKDGSILDVNINKIKNKYGNSEELEKLDSIMHRHTDSNVIMPRGKFTDCMIDAIKDYFGIGLLGIITSGTVYKLITKKAWKEVAVILAKNIAKVAGKYIGPASIVVTLVYYAGKCAYIANE